MTPSDPLLGAERRLHPMSLLFRVIPLLKSFLVPAALVFFVADGEEWQKWLPLLILPGFLIELYRVRTLRYRFAEEEMVVTTGRWFRGERHIPYERIQNIDLVQGVLHRMLGVGEVRIETASGAGAEASLVVLSRDAELELRAAVARGRSSSEEVLDETREHLPEPPPLLSLGGAELFRLAIDPGRSLIPLGVLFGLAWEFDLFERFAVWDRVSDWFEAGGLGLGWLDGVIIGLAAFLLVSLLSFIGTVLLFHGFRLRLEDEQFRIERGLLTRVRASIPRRRIQTVSLRESWLHRRMGRMRVRVGTAGKGGNEVDDHEEESWLAPLVDRAGAERILHAIDSRFSLQTLDWHAFPKSSRRRSIRAAVRKGVLIGGAIVGALLWSPQGSWAFALAPLPLCWMLMVAFLEHRTRAYAWDGICFAFREGVFNRRTSFVVTEKVQSVSLGQGVFDRRWNHAQLLIDTAGAAQAGHSFRLRRMPKPVAEALKDRLLVRAERARFRWR